jgi:hypothetical protein
VIDNTVYVKQPWPMLGNDRYGDCVFASSGHRRITQAAMNGTQVYVTKTEALRAYAAVTGFNPKTGANDNGAVMVDAANWERHHRLFNDIVYAFARIQIDPRDRELMDLATAYFGGVWMGVWLPATAQRQTGPGKVWDYTPGPGSEPGSWGGHAIWVPKSEPGSRTCVTWATLQQMTDAFIEHYADEAWVILPNTWHRKDPFDAIDWASLDNAMARFGPVNQMGGFAWDTPKP